MRRLILLSLFAALATACSDSTDETTQRFLQESREALDAAKAFAMDKITVLREKTGEELTRLDGEMDRLRDKLKSEAQEFRDDHQELFEKLEERRRIAGERLAELKDVTAEKWEAAHDNLKVALDELSQAYDDYRERTSDE